MTTVIAGASGGIGLALCRQLLQRESSGTILALGRQAEQSGPLASLAADSAGRLTPLNLDVTRSSGTNARLAEVLGKDCQVERIIYAVGLLHDQTIFPEKRLEDVRIEDLTRSFQVNAAGLLVLVQGLMPWLRHRQPKAVLALSAKVGSLADNRFGGWYAYRCAKAALNMAVVNLSIELERRCRPVHCVALHPGTTRTSLSAPFSRAMAQLKVHDPEATATHLLDLAAGFTEADNGCFYSWDGSRLPW